MTCTRIGLRTLLPAVLVAGAVASPAVADDFYKGKTITMTMGTSPGGSFQVYAQVFARFMPKYIPGKPTIVPAYMPGGGGTKAANYLYNVAAQDGSQILMSHSINLAQKLQPKGIKFDAAKFQWLGSFSAITQILTVWHTVPMNSIDDAKKKEIILSAFSKSHLTYQWLALTNATLGTKFKIIPGYRGGAKNNMAMERGETAGWTASWSNLNGTKADWLRDKKVKLMVVYALKRLPAIPDVPTLAELVSAKDKPIVDFMTAGTPVSRSFAVGPKVPKDRVAILRTALEKTLADPEFVAEAKKRGLTIDPLPWQETEKLVKMVTSASPALVSRVKKAIGL